MTDYAHWILHQLLDRYERSAHYHNPGRSHRAVLLRFDRPSFPDYWDDTGAETRHLIHLAVERLAAAGLVAVHRDHRLPGQPVARVDLVLERVEEAYRQADRTPRRHLEDQLATTAAHWQGKLPAWAEPFLQDIASALAAGQPLPAGLGPGDDRLLADICHALAAAPGPEAPLPRRVFSLRTFGDSKRFEREVEGQFVRVARAYLPGAPAERRELLAELGIVENPDFLFLWGPLTLGWGPPAPGMPAGVLDLGAVGTPLGIPAAAVDSARMLSVKAARLITVENLTSFHQLVQAAPPNTIAVYLGGYHNRLRHRFLRRLREFDANLIFLHWGDIDLGGFRIFRYLREGSGVPLAPWHMDAATLRRHLHLAAPFDAAYARQLQDMLSDEGYADFHDVIRLMLAEGKRLEQESVEPMSDSGDPSSI